MFPHLRLYEILTSVPGSATRKGGGFGGGMAVRRVSVSHIMGGGKPLKLVPPTRDFISGTPGGVVRD